MQGTSGLATKFERLPAQGTYGLDASQTQEAVEAALRLGYRHIDTAEMASSPRCAWHWGLVCRN